MRLSYTHDFGILITLLDNEIIIKQAASLAKRIEPEGWKGVAERSCLVICMQMIGAENSPKGLSQIIKHQFWQIEQCEMLQKVFYVLKKIWNVEIVLFYPEKRHRGTNEGRTATATSELNTGACIS